MTARQYVAFMLGFLALGCALGLLLATHVAQPF